MRTPPLVSAVGAGPELVHDGVTGRVLPPARPEAWAGAVSELLADRAALGRMGERGPAEAARFRDDVHAREMLAVYERTVDGRAPRQTTVGAVGSRSERGTEATWLS
jgi:glycosyltransferase involved in cell wall biosynthesis